MLPLSESYSALLRLEPSPRSGAPSGSRSPRRARGFVAGAALLSVFSLGGTPAAMAAPTRTLVIPTTKLGAVRSINQRRIARGIERTLSFSGQLTVTRDKDRPSQEGKTNGVGARKISRLEKQIEEADKLRSRGMALEAKDPLKAYALFKKAIKRYERAAPELVDFTKLADAYTRAGITAFRNRAGTKNVRAWFKKGLVLQPTLVINRRGQSAKLLKLFDATVKHMQGLKKVSVEVIGGCPQNACPKAEVYVDGIKIGPVPAKRSGLTRGLHFIQMRGKGAHPWGKIVLVGRPNFTIKAKPKAIVTKRSKPVVTLTFADIADCAATGRFVRGGCNKQVQFLLRQTDSALVLFTVIKADRYGRLSLHGFLARPPVKRRKPSQVVSLKAVEIKKNLSDLNARLTDFAAIVDKAAADFPVARALRKTPRLFRD